MRRAVFAGLLRYPVRQDAGEQEVPGHDDPAGSQQAASLQAGLHAGVRQRNERRLGERVVPAFPEQPRGLAYLGVGVRVGGPARDQQHGRRRPAGRGPGLLGYPRRQQFQQHRVRAERAPVAPVQAGMTGPLPGQRGRDVALGVAGRGQHERHGDHAPVTAPGELGDRVPQRRVRQLDEPAGHLDPLQREAGLQPGGERGERSHPGRIPGAVTGDQERWTVHGITSSSLAGAAAARSGPARSGTARSGTARSGTARSAAGRPLPP